MNLVIARGVGERVELQTQICLPAAVEGPVEEGDGAVSICSSAPYKRLSLPFSPLAAVSTFCLLAMLALAVSISCSGAGL